MDAFSLEAPSILLMFFPRPTFSCIDELIRDVWNRLFNFGSVSVLEKNSDSVRNEFGSVRFGLQKLGSVRIVIY